MPIEDKRTFSIISGNYKKMYREGDAMTLELSDDNGKTLTISGNLRWRMQYPHGCEECCYVTDNLGREFKATIHTYADSARDYAVLSAIPVLN